MTFDDFLSLLAIVLAPFSVLSTAVLWHAARGKPRIGALTERAALALVIAVMVCSGALITLNRLTSNFLFPLEWARLLFLSSLVLLACVPVAWLFLWLTNRLGE